MCSFRGTPSSMAVEKDPAPRARGAVDVGFTRWAAAHAPCGFFGTVQGSTYSVRVSQGSVDGAAARLGTSGDLRLAHSASRSLSVAVPVVAMHALDDPLV
jgi:hypothetical protein